MIRVVLVALLLSVTAFADSMYVPMCFETKPRAKKNMVIVLSGSGLGPYKLNSAGQPFNPGNEATFSIGYMRLLRPDLALGLMVDGHTQGVSGFKVGFSYLFED